MRCLAVGRAQKQASFFFITHERTESISLMSYLQERCDMKKGFEKYIQKWGKEENFKVLPNLADVYSREFNNDNLSANSEIVVFSRCTKLWEV